MGVDAVDKLTPELTIIVFQRHGTYGITMKLSTIQFTAKPKYKYL